MGQDMGQDVRVPGATGRAEAAVGAQAHERGSGELLARRERHGRTVLSGAAGESGPSVGGALHGDTPAPAPREGRAPHPAVVLRRLTRVEHQPRVRVVAGDPAPACQHGFAVRQRVATQLALGGPLARDMAEPVVPQRRQGPGGRVGAQQGDRFLARVADDGPALDDVRVLVHPVVERHLQGVAAVAEGQRQLARLDVVAGRLPLEGAGAVGEPDLQGRRPVARTAVDGELLPDGRPALEAAGLGRGRDGEFPGLRGRQSWAPRDMAGHSGLVDPQRVRGARCGQQPDPGVRGEGDRRHESSRSGGAHVRDKEKPTLTLDHVSMPARILDFLGHRYLLGHPQENPVSFIDSRK